MSFRHTLTNIIEHNNSREQYQDFASCYSSHDCLPTKNSFVDVRKTDSQLLNWTCNNIKMEILKSSRKSNDLKKRPQSQEEIIEECKNSLNELIKVMENYQILILLTKSILI